MIDAHVHVVPPNLPGVGPLSLLLEGPLDVLAAALHRQMQAAHVTAVLAMGMNRMAQRRAIIQLRNQGAISTDVMHRVERDLDLEDSRLEI